MPGETCIIGTGIGSLAAAAVASSPSLSGLAQIAVQAVLVAFRLGMKVEAMANILEGDAGPSQSWAYVLPGVLDDTCTSVLRNFQEQHVSGSYITICRPEVLLIE